MGKKSKERRGSSMARGNREARKNRKLGKKWLTVPKGISVFKEEVNTYKIDILPYIVKDVKHHPEGEHIQEDMWFRYPYKLHRGIGPNKESVICPTTIDKQCPICDKRQEIFDDPDMDNKIAGRYKASPRSLFALKMLFGDKENKGKILIWDVSDNNFYEEVCKELDNGEEEYENFMLLEGGYTLKVRMIEESFDKTKYIKTDRVDFLERDDYDESILDEIPCLDECIVPNIKSAKEIQALLDGVDDYVNDKDDDDDEEEEEEKPNKKGKGKEVKKDKKQDKKPDKKKAKTTWEDLEKLDEDELLEFAEENDVEIDEDEIEDEEALRIYIAEQLNIEVPEPEEEEEEEEEEEKHKKKGKKEEQKKQSKKQDKKKSKDDDDDDDEEEEEEKPNKKGKGKEKTKNTKNALKCPFAYNFGAEFGDHDECNEEDCKKHDDCFEEYDKLNE